MTAQPMTRYLNGVWADALWRTLAAAGVEQVVVSPGSRSTPLSLAAESAEGLTVRLALDERSAGFFALGLAKGSGKPVALVCTSGTAAANYHPAVVEAHQSRIPLIVVTADRPPRLRGVGAAQTIDQIHLYGHAVRRFAELPVPALDAATLRGMTAQVALAAASAIGAPKGPVHLNAPFDEPLAPPAVADPAAVALAAGFSVAPRVAPGKLRADEGAIAELAARLNAAERPVIVAGPDASDAASAPAVLAWAEAAGVPIVADIGSGLRGHSSHGAVVASAAEGFLRTPGWLDTAPDLVVRLGGAPTGKGILTWLDRHLAPTVYVQPDGEGRDHQAIAELTIVGDVATSARALTRLAAPRAPRWAQSWRAAEAAAIRAIEAGPIPFEASMVREAAAQLGAGGVLCLSNSLPIRHADTYLGAAEGLSVSVYRGANGIDGVTSMSLGMAVGTGRPTLLVTGDLAFLHDLGGLQAAKHLETPMVLLVINNDGGGIFSYLPIAQATEHFETLFGTPHGLGFEAAARLFQLPYARTTDGAGVAEAVARGLSAPGLSIVEVIANREATAAEHKAFVARLATALEEQPV